MKQISISSVLSRLDVPGLQSLYPHDAFNLVLRVLHRQSAEDLQKSLTETISIIELLTPKKNRKTVLHVLQPEEAETLLEAYSKPSSGLHSKDLQFLEKFLDQKEGEPEGLHPFYRAFGVSDLELHAAEEDEDDERGKEITTFASEAKPNYPLHPYQRSLLNKVISCFQGFQRPIPATRALLHMPTGSGKTRTAMVLACRYLLDHPEGLVIWLADTFELCTQAASEFLIAWGNLGDRSIPVYRIYGKLNERPDYKTIENGFLVATLQSATAARRAERDQNLETLSALASHKPLVIVDEAHKAAAKEYSKVIETLVPVTLGTRRAHLLGLSATPGRATSDMIADKKLVTMFGGNIFTLKVDGYQTAIDYLTSEGYLARANFRQINSDINYDLLNLSDREKKGYFTQSRLQEVTRLIGEDVERNYLIYQELRNLSLKHKRIIFFAASVEQSKRMAYVLRLTGIAARSVSSDSITHAERVSVINWYKTPRRKAPEPRIICNYGILTTGFDAPETSAVLIGRPASSLVLFSQMVGRGLRGIKAGGNEEAEIVTVVDHGIEAFVNVSSAFTHWDRSWSNFYS